MIKSILFIGFIGIGAFILKQPSPTTNKEAIAMKVELKTINEIESKYGLRFCGSGGGMMDCVRLMSLSFNCNKPMSMIASNELVSKCVYLYLDNINNNEEIQPHLCDRPFKPSNVQIIIFFQQKNGEVFPGMNFSSVTARNGISRFFDSRNLSAKEVPIVSLEKLKIDE